MANIDEDFSSFGPIQVMRTGDKKRPRVFVHGVEVPHVVKVTGQLRRLDIPDLDGISSEQLSSGNFGEYTLKLGGYRVKWTINLEYLCKIGHDPKADFGHTTLAPWVEADVIDSLMARIMNLESQLDRLKPKT